MKFPRSELYLVTGHNSLPLGKVVLSMGSRSLFQVHSFLSRLSHAVEQAMGWATVQRVLPCREYRTISKNAKGLGWWHWNAKRQPLIAATKSVSSNSCPQTRDSRRREALWAEFLTKAPWKLTGSVIPPGTPDHGCLVVPWTQTVDCGRTVRSQPLAEITVTVLHLVCKWKEHQFQLLMKNPVNWTPAWSAWFN